MRPGTPGFVGVRLRQARLYHGLSISELARRIETSQPTVSAYERGGSTPGPVTLDRLCAELGFSREFFLRPAPNRDAATPVHYRSLHAATKIHRERAEERLGWIEEATEFVESFVTLPAVNLPEIDVPADPTELSDDRIEEVAAELRWTWRLGEGAISDLVLLMENNGIVVVRFPLGSPKLDAFSRLNGLSGRPHIVLSSEKLSGARSRFDAAHELGHLVLHRRVRDAVARKSEVWKLMEEQAHRFAGAFLLPPRSFAASVPYISLTFLQELKLKWRVSIGAMLFRAHHLGLTSSAQAAQLWETYGRRRWKTREPYDESIVPEIPRLLRRAVEMVVSHGVVTPQGFSDALHLPAGELETLVGLPEGFLNGDKALVSLRAGMVESSRSTTQNKVIAIDSRR